jgi:hypothetical protein
MDEYGLVGRDFVFTSPYEQYADRIGQKAVVLGEIPHDSFDYDECGPLYMIRFYDGAKIEAWPEEIDPSLMEG